MREALRQVNSTALAVYIGAVDATVWLAALPFELFCRTLVATHAPSWQLVGVLCVNLLLLAAMTLSVVATGELVRRGFTRRVRVPVRLRPFAPGRSRRSAR
jgi:hypothetical protein